MAARCTRGFSLVELSIVLVILGLLVGGVLSGQALIHAAELRSVMKDQGEYQIAVNSFKSKYFQLPGDINNATSFWPSTCLDHAGTSQTCNGDGDGVIKTTVGGNYEHIRFWQHLSLAGLVTGSYMAINNGSAAFASGASNNGYAPKSRIANACFVPDADTTALSAFPIRAMGAREYAMTFGALTDDNACTGGVLKPEDAYNIDAKSDDGKPLMGKVQGTDGKDAAFTFISPSCINVADYRLNDSTTSCALVFPH